MNYRCYHIILRVKCFYTNRERCEVLTGYLSLGCRPGGDWANTWRWTKRFRLFFKKEVAAAPVTSAYSSLSHSSRRPLLEIRVYYALIIIIICINNDAIINNNLRKTSRPIFCYSKFPWARERIFFEIYRQFWHAPSKSFASPGLGRCGAQNA